MIKCLITLFLAAFVSLETAADDAVSERFTEVFGRAHRLIMNASFKSVSHTDGTFTVKVVAEGAEHSVKSDTLLVATGRRTNSDKLGIDATGGEVDGKGFIQVDPYLRTNVEGIWALGDIVPTHSFKHSANQEADSSPITSTTRPT